MSRTFHTKREYMALMKKLGYAGASTAASRHPGGTRAKGLRKQATNKIHVAADRNRFGDAYEKSSRMRRIRRYVKHAVRQAAEKNICKMMMD